MRFQDKLGMESKESLWNEYCGFLNLSVAEFMKIQRRLLIEQMTLWSKSPLGKSILKGKKPQTLEEFRRLVPLTTYEELCGSAFIEAGLAVAGRTFVVDPDDVGRRRSSFKGSALYKGHVGDVSKKCHGLFYVGNRKRPL